MVGEPTGALYGVGALSDEWVEQVVRLNPEPDLTQVAEDMCDAISERAVGQQRRAADALSMLRGENAVASPMEPSEEGDCCANT